MFVNLKGRLDICQKSYKNRLKELSLILSEEECQEAMDIIMENTVGSL